MSEEEGNSGRWVLGPKCMRTEAASPPIPPHPACTERRGCAPSFVVGEKKRLGMARLERPSSPKVSAEDGTTWAGDRHQHPRAESVAFNRKRGVLWEAVNVCCSVLNKRIHRVGTPHSQQQHSQSPKTEIARVSTGRERTKRGPSTQP